MRYSKIRKYISERVKDYSSKFKEHNNAFDSTNIPRSNIDRAYFIEYSVPSISDGPDGAFYSSATATVQFYFKGFRNPTKALDSAMDTVGEISQAISSLTNVFEFRSTDDFPIQKCFPTSQTSEPLGDNDNSIVVTLDLDLEIILTNC